MTTSRDRQAKFRKAMQAKGLKQVTYWVPAERAADVKVLCDLLCEYPVLEPGPLRSTTSGKLVSQADLPARRADWFRQ